MSTTKETVKNVTQKEIKINVKLVPLVSIHQKKLENVKIAQLIVMNVTQMSNVLNVLLVTNYYQNQKVKNHVKNVLLLKKVVKHVMMIIVLVKNVMKVIH